MARKRPRSASAAPAGPGVRFVPARGAAPAASAGILGRLAGGASGGCGDSGGAQAARRAELLAKLAAIEAKKAKLAEEAVAEGAVVEVGADEGVPVAGKARLARGKSQSRKTGKMTGKAAPRGGKSAAPAKGKVKPAAVPQRSTGSRRTARPRMQSVMLSNLPGENERVRTSEMTRCAAVVFCRKLIAAMLRAPTGNPFSAPVLELWSEEDVPRYAEIVKHPMDLSTIKRRLETPHYLRQPGCCSGVGRIGDGGSRGSSSSCEIVATSPLSLASNPSPSTLSFPALSGTLDGMGSNSARSTGCTGDARDVVDLIRDDVVVTAPPTRRTGFEFDLGSFCADVRLCFNNCLLYCASAEPLHGTARALLDKFNLDIADCPAPVPVLPERKKEKLSSRSVAEFAANSDLVCDLTATEATSSALSVGSGTEPPAKKSRRGAKGTATKRSSTKKSTVKAASDESVGSYGSFAGEEEEDAKVAAELPKPPKPENPRVLRRRLEYLRQCRVRVVSRENGINDVPMTREEKTRLTVRIGHIPVDKVPQLVRIISRASKKPSVAEKDEIEIDLDKLSAVCLRELETFVDGCVAPNIGGEPVQSRHADIGSEFDSVHEVEAEMADVSAKLATVKAQRAHASSSGGLWDDSSSSDGSSSGESCEDSSDSDSSDED